MLPSDPSTQLVQGPPRSFFVVAVAALTAGVAIGGFVFNAHYFYRAIGLATLISSLAAGVAGQIDAPWSRSQRTLMLVTAASLGVAAGLFGRFILTASTATWAR